MGLHGRHRPPGPISWLSLLLIALVKVSLGRAAPTTPADEVNSQGVTYRLNGDWLYAEDAFIRALELSELAAETARRQQDIPDLNTALRDHYHSAVNALAAFLAMIYPRNLVAHVLAVTSEASGHFCGSNVSQSSFYSSPWPHGLIHPVIAPIHAIASRSYGVWGGTAPGSNLVGDFDAHRIAIERSWQQLLFLSLWPHNSLQQQPSSQLLQPLLRGPDAASYALMAAGMMEAAYIAGIDRYLATQLVESAAAISSAGSDNSGVSRTKRGIGVDVLIAAAEKAKTEAKKSGSEAAGSPYCNNHGASSSTSLPPPLRLAFTSSDLRRHSVGYALHGVMWSLARMKGRRRHHVSAYALAPVDIEPSFDSDGKDSELLARLEWQPQHETALAASYPPLWRASPSSGAKKRLNALPDHCEGAEDCPLGPSRLMNRLPSGDRETLRALVTSKHQDSQGEDSITRIMMSTNSRSGARQISDGKTAAALLAQRLSQRDKRASAEASKRYSEASLFSHHSFLGECVWPATITEGLDVKERVIRGGFTQTHCLAQATTDYSFFALDSAMLPSHRAKTGGNNSSVAGSNHSNSRNSASSAGSANEWISKPQDFWASSNEEEALLALWERNDPLIHSEPHVLFELNGRSVGGRQKLLQRYAQRKAERRARIREQMQGQAHVELCTNEDNDRNSGAEKRYNDSPRAVFYFREKEKEQQGPEVAADSSSSLGAVVISYLGSPLSSSLGPPRGTIDYLATDAYGLPPELLSTKRSQWAKRRWRESWLRGDVPRRRHTEDADEVVATAPELIRSHGESLIYLPAPYHPVTVELGGRSPIVAASDAKRKRDSHAATCPDGSGKKKLIFGALHAVTKIDARTFTTWVQIVLRSSSCSELWLLRPQGVPPLSFDVGAALPKSVVDRERSETGACINDEEGDISDRGKPCDSRHYTQGEDVQAALKMEAAARGLHPARIRFVGMEGGRDNRTTMAALYPQIDIMLDAQAWGSHSTAADLLSVGVPLLTTVTDDWPSRVGATFLKALSADDKPANDLHLSLVTHGLVEMEEVGTRLARDEALLAQRLSDRLTRSSKPASRPASFDWSKRADHLSTGARAGYEALRLRESMNALRNPDRQSSEFLLPNIIVAST
jgi:hypothetical protein